MPALEAKMRHSRGKRKRNGEQDYKWRKGKKSRKLLESSREPKAFDDFSESGPPPQFRKETNQDIKARQTQARRQRKAKHDAERAADDSEVRCAPNEFLWRKYTEWAGNKLTNVEKNAGKWQDDNVFVLEDEGDNIVAQIGEICGDDYLTRTGWKKRSTASVAILCLSVSAIGACKLSKNLYDGMPVAKFFGKHSKIDDQKKFLKKASKRVLIKSIIGTPRRFGRLIEEEELTLKHTSALVVDMERDSNLRNIFDMRATREDFCTFLHDHARQYIDEGSMKVILRIPKVQVTTMDDAVRQGTRSTPQEKPYHKKKPNQSVDDDQPVNAHDADE